MWRCNNRKPSELCLSICLKMKEKSSSFDLSPSKREVKDKETLLTFKFSETCETGITLEDIRLDGQRLDKVFHKKELSMLQENLKGLVKVKRECNQEMLKSKLYTLYVTKEK